MRLRCFAPTIKCAWQPYLNATSVLAEVGVPHPHGKQHQQQQHVEKGWLWHLNVKDTRSAIQTLHAFSKRMTKKQKEMMLPRLLVLEHTKTKSVDDSVSHLREILPVSAEFLDGHPFIGGPYSYGRSIPTSTSSNDHGKIVTGICHLFPHHSLSELAALLDVCSNTRLMLSMSNMDRTSTGTTVPGTELEAVIEKTDAICIESSHLYVDTYNYQMIWDQIWHAQERDGCRETYCMLRSNIRGIGEQNAREIQTQFHGDMQGISDRHSSANKASFAVKESVKALKDQFDDKP